MNDNRSIVAIVAIVATTGFLGFVGAPAVADGTAPGGLAECAAIEADAARLECFDALAASREAPPPAPPAPPATPVAEPGMNPITDDIGLERVQGADRDAATVYSANVTRCEENQQSGQTYFFFENGQVWRQANYRRLRFRDCRFEIELSEDNFGYSMYVPTEDRRFRVTRIR